MQHDHVLNKLTFDHRVRGAGRGDLPPKYLHVAAFAILFNFICNITMFSISLILTFNPTPKVEWGRERYVGRIFAAMFLNSRIYLILYDIL